MNSKTQSLAATFCENVAALLKEKLLDIEGNPPTIIDLISNSQEPYLSDLPLIGFVWSGQSFPDNFQARRFEKGRLELHFYQAIQSNDATLARTYTEDLKEKTNRLFKRNSQKLGLRSIAPLVSTPGVAPGRPDVLDLRAEYECLLA